MTNTGVPAQSHSATSGPINVMPLTIGQAYAGTGTVATNWTASAAYNPLEPVITINSEKTILEVEGKMVLNGQDLEERLRTIEKVLTMPERDVTMESKHPKLKKLYDEYINALAKYRTFEAIKGEK